MSTRRKALGHSKRKGNRHAVINVDTDRLAREIANCIATPFAKRYVHDLTGQKNPALTADSYDSAYTFKHDYLLYNLLRKFDDSSDLKGQSALETAAYDLFRKNDEKLGPLSGTLTWTNLALNEPLCHSILLNASGKIRSVLGTLNLNVLAENASYSGGATALQPRTRGRQPFKFANCKPEVTTGCAKLAASFIEASPIWSPYVDQLQLVDGNRLTTVPKNSTIRRVIACEPTLNMYVQKGIGTYIRSRLLRVGVNLNDQTINQRLAQIGSVDGSLATVDVEAASDSLSVALVKLVCPQEWFDLLMTCRSEVGLITSTDDTIEYLEYNKISSMGNGYTFELESLIFWAIAQACEDELARSRGRYTSFCSVYGDDIILSTEAVPSLKMVFDLVGFSFNDEKSFYLGPFRESCGRHYFNGYDVSPFFIREPIASTYQLIGTCNRLRRWYSLFLYEHDPTYKSVHDGLVRRLPLAWRKPTIPDGIGDGALFGSFDEVLPNYRHGCYRAKVLIEEEKSVMTTQLDGTLVEFSRRKDGKSFKPLSDKDIAVIHSTFTGHGGYLQWLSTKQQCGIPGQRPGDLASLFGAKCSVRNFIKSICSKQLNTVSYRNGKFIVSYTTRHTESLRSSDTDEASDMMPRRIATPQGDVIVTSVPLPGSVTIKTKNLLVVDGWS